MGLSWDHQDVISSGRHDCACVLQRCGTQSWLAQLPIIDKYRGDHAYTVAQSYMISALRWSTYTIAKQVGLACSAAGSAQHNHAKDIDPARIRTQKRDRRSMFDLNEPSFTYWEEHAVPCVRQHQRTRQAALAIG